jgi:hypothetical protein
MGASAPDSVKRLVDLFDLEQKVYQSPDYKEEQLRAELLNPFFSALGWDMGDAIDTIRARDRKCPSFPPDENAACLTLTCPAAAMSAMEPEPSALTEGR